MRLSLIFLNGILHNELYFNKLDIQFDVLYLLLFQSHKFIIAKVCLMFQVKGLQYHMKVMQVLQIIHWN